LASNRSGKKIPSEKETVMENRLPQKRATLFSQAESMAAGCAEHETSVQLAQNKETNILSDLDAAAASENIFQAARSAKLDAVKDQRTADKSARAFIVTARDVLKPHLGTSWSQLWAEAGFVNNSLAVPKAQANCIALLIKLKSYFAAHPAHEVAQMGATAAAAENHHATLSAARASVNACRAEVGEKKAARSAATKRLRKRMRGLIAELKQLLPGDDARWAAFGLNRPAARPVPAPPRQLRVAGAGRSHLLASWQAPAHAQRFRIFKQIVGVDADFVLAATVTDTSVNLNTFASGTVVRVRLTAVNDAGESGPCAPVEQTVP
jgi:hypothetical protein